MHRLLFEGQHLVNATALIFFLVFVLSISETKIESLRFVSHLHQLCAHQQKVLGKPIYPTSQYFEIASLFHFNFYAPLFGTNSVIGPNCEYNEQLQYNYTMESCRKASK